MELKGRECPEQARPFNEKQARGSMLEREMTDEVKQGILNERRRNKEWWFETRVKMTYHPDRGWDKWFNAYGVW